jgi:hypothetical protein
MSRAGPSPTPYAVARSLDRIREVTFDLSTAATDFTRFARVITAPISGNLHT